MLVTFFCDAYENITVFGSVAKTLLNFMQHSGNVPGAILAKDVPEALFLLKESILKERTKEELLSSSSADDEEPEIGISKRAIPIIALFESAVKANCDVMWRRG